MGSDDKIIKQHGGYRHLKSFQVAQLVYDGTVVFCEHYVDRFSRTCDQMVQAARSGVQNIAEGSKASATSKKSELKLTNVARASLEELLLDYEDFLRQRGLVQWAKEDPRYAAVIKLRAKNITELREWINGPHGHYGLDGPDGQRASTKERAANALLVLTNVAISLLGRQIERLAKDFEENGGFTERLYNVRKNNRP